MSLPTPTPRPQTFAFNSEFDVLEARLRELNDVVDAFVLVEATVAFSGKRKPLWFRENATDTRWDPFRHKLHNVVLDAHAFDPLPAGLPRQHTAPQADATDAVFLSCLRRGRRSSCAPQAGNKRGRCGGPGRVGRRPTRLGRVQRP